MNRSARDAYLRALCAAVWCIREALAATGQPRALRYLARIETSPPAPRGR